MKKHTAGGCGCGGGRKTRKHRSTRKKGGSLVGDAILAGTAVGLYSYFAKKKGGARRLPTRKTRKALV